MLYAPLYTAVGIIVAEERAISTYKIIDIISCEIWVLQFLLNLRRYKNAPEAKTDEEEDAQTAVVAAPAPVQPVMQPATNVVINNTGFQPAPTQYQPQQQVNQSFQMEVDPGVRPLQNAIVP